MDLVMTMHWTLNREAGYCLVPREMVLQMYYVQVKGHLELTLAEGFSFKLEGICIMKHQVTLLLFVANILREEHTDE